MHSQNITTNVCTHFPQLNIYQVPCVLRHLFLFQEHNSSSESTWALSCTLLVLVFCFSYHRSMVVLVFCFSYHRSMVPYRRSMVQSIDGTDNKVNSLSLCASPSLYPLTRTYPWAGTGYHVNEQYLRHVVRILFSSRFVLCSCNDHVLHTSIHFQKNVLVWSGISRLRVRASSLSNTRFGFQSCLGTCCRSIRLHAKCNCT